MSGWRPQSVIVAIVIGIQIFNPYSIIGPISIADFALAVGIGLIVLYQLVYADAWFAAGTRPLLILLLLFMGWTVVIAGGWHVPQFLAFTSLIIFISLSVRSIVDIEYVLWGLFTGGTVVAAMTLYAIFVDPSFGGRVFSVVGRGPLPPLPRTLGLPLVSPGVLSTYFLAPLPFVILKWRRTHQNWLLLPILTVLAATVFIQSRATWVALIVALSVLAAGVFGRRIWDIGWKNAGASILVLVLNTGLVVFASYALIQINSRSAISRLRQFSRASNLIIENPITGIAPPVTQYFSEFIPHNIILLLGVIGGVPAMFWFYAVLGVAVLGLWRGWHDTARSRQLSLAIAAGLAASLVNLSFTPGLTRAFWILIASGVILNTGSMDTIYTMSWIQAAVENSRVASTLQHWSNGSIIIGTLTYNAMPYRDKIVTAWKRSTARHSLEKIRAATMHSTAVQLLFG